VRARALTAVAAVALLAGCGGHHAERRTSPTPSITVRVDGAAHTVRRGTTLQRLVARFHLAPRAGSLLAANGAVLRRARFPGAVLVDGRTAAASRRLRDGDRITLRAGPTRRERLVQIRVDVPHGLLPDPERTLARVPGVAVVTRGAISHQVVRTHFEPLAELPAEPPAVALTFDDGPSLYTPRILAVLQRYDVPATFFTIGYLADVDREFVDAELAAGMQVGNHSYNHPQVPPFGTLPDPLLFDEIALGADSVRRAGGSPTVFRPPAGSVSPAVVRDADRLRERVVLWSVDPGDWKAGATAAGIARSVLGGVRPGSIVVLHDGGGDRSATVAALPTIIRGIRRRGLRLVTVDGY
jgi:peptidoglycan/xylan/chitin deacetylase (PgdA/CDA1 family)/sulfur carrier protein ThiS